MQTTIQDENRSNGKRGNQKRERQNLISCNYPVLGLYNHHPEVRVNRVCGMATSNGQEKKKKSGNHPEVREKNTHMVGMHMQDTRVRCDKSISTQGTEQCKRAPECARHSRQVGPMMLKRLDEILCERLLRSGSRAVRGQSRCSE